MAEKTNPEVGSITWFDLTAKNADKIKDFYSQVVGWKSDNVSMGDYDDFTMIAPESGNPVAGICHAAGPNKKLPPQWMIYITVEKIDQSIESVKKLGGTILDGPKEMESYGKFCFIQDPAGAACALFEPLKE